MRFLIKISLLTLFTTLVEAGDLGAISSNYLTTPFVVGELSASHIQYESEIFNNYYSSQINNIWGGRFGVGLTRKYRGLSSLTCEIGYGYYGRVRTSFVNNINNNFYALDGLDALVGFLYRLKDLDVFFKTGAIIENKRLKGSLDLSAAFPGNRIEGTQNYNSNYTQVLPTLKTGGMYNINTNIAISLAYMHVFGSRTSFLADNSTQTKPLTINTYSSIHNQNPSFDAVLLGIQYNLT